MLWPAVPRPSSAASAILPPHSSRRVLPACCHGSKAPRARLRGGMREGGGGEVGSGASPGAAATPRAGRPPAQRKHAKAGRMRNGHRSAAAAVQAGAPMAAAPLCCARRSPTVARKQRRARFPSEVWGGRAAGISTATWADPLLCSADTRRGAVPGKARPCRTASAGLAPGRPSQALVRGAQLRLSESRPCPSRRDGHRNRALGPDLMVRSSVPAWNAGEGGLGKAGLPEARRHDTAKPRRGPGIWLGRGASRA
jgi:hypothetical protein